MSEPIKNDFTLVSYKKGINKTLGKRIDGVLLDFDEAEEIIVEYITDKKKAFIEEGKVIPVKTKEDLRQEKQVVREWITNCILEKNMSIRGFQGSKIEEFIEEMVGEYAGYSALEDAFADDEISDIFCIDYKTIFVEKKGANVKYWKSFRSPEHYKNVVERFIRTNGKEINNGENKIVDFELYGDRGCATCPVVSPRDYSMTMRKHAEDHIILDQLLEWQLMNEEMKELFGMMIDGEANLIYAGLTGSGKTTSIRAMIDYFVTKNQRRMLVCEDTQELFPSNEHTLELVSVKTDKKETSVPLDALILTALRLKPKYIIVGEVRGAECQAAVEAMETGHSTIFTMHGGKPMNIVNRLVTKYLMAMPELGIDVVERIIGEAVDYIAIQDNIPGTGRKITIIAEISYNYDTGRVAVTPIFEYDFEVEDFVLRQRISKDKAFKMLRRGIKLEYAKQWIREDDPEEEKKICDEINAKYQREKPERMKMYAERKANREAAKSEHNAHGTETEKLAKKTINKAIQNEDKKQKEIEALVEQTENINQTKSDQTEENTNTDTNTDTDNTTENNSENSENKE